MMDKERNKNEISDVRSGKYPIELLSPISIALRARLSVSKNSPVCLSTRSMIFKSSVVCFVFNIDILS